MPPLLTGVSRGAPPAPATTTVALEDLPRCPRVVTIGTFDGVHLGHLHLLGQTVARGRELALPALAVTFEPPPAAVLRPDRFLGRLCTAEEKAAQVVACGLEAVAVVPFSRDLAAETPEAFLARLAATGLRELWVGDDFALGRHRSGDLPRLREIGRDLGFDLVPVPRIALGGEPLSSSAIRAAVLAGDVATARRLLGRPFRVGGEVIHGQKLGRTIGFPTANVAPPPDLVPLADGIYASWAWLPGDHAPRPAMTYVGTRPTVNAGPRLVETHLLDFDGDLYGRELRVDLLERLRADETFASLEAMVAQLQRDEAAARAVLTEPAVGSPG